MGALEYEPDASSIEEGTLPDLDILAEESRRILGEREYHGEHLDDLLRLNGSLAGARPKIMLSIPDEDGTLQPWIIKFRALEDRPDAGLVEYRHSLAARLAGLDMPETRLFPSKDGAGYFGIKRFDRRDAFIRENIPSGFGVRREAHDRADRLDLDLVCGRHVDKRRAALSLGTLGGGNHFIEVAEGESGLWLIIHSGSRRLGLEVAGWYQNMAGEACKTQGIPYELSFLDGQPCADYLAPAPRALPQG